MKSIYVWGYLHQCGGAGPEAGHAIELLVSNGVEVTCVLKPGTDVLSNSELRRKYFDAIGVRTVEYQPGIFKDKVVWSWCEPDLFAHIFRNEEKPASIVYWPCMSELADAEKVAIAALPNMRVLCQSVYQQSRIKQAICELGLKDITEHCRPYFNILSPWNKFRMSQKDYSRFDVLRIGRDDADKYPNNLWDIIYRVASPKPKGIHVLGWGPSGEQKLGDHRNADHPFNGKVSGTIRGHVYEPDIVGDIMSACHANIMYYPCLENFPRAALESMASGTVVVASNTGGMPELIKDGITGYLCDTEEEVVYRLSQLACDRDTRNTIAQSAYVDLGQDVGNGAFAFSRFSSYL